MNCGDYPMGAHNDRDAPWNKNNDISEEEIEVTVSLTLSKTFKIKTGDYSILEESVDEEGHPYTILDFSSCDLKSEVEKQITLPHEAVKIIKKLKSDCGIYCKNLDTAIENLNNWNIDEFEVIKE